MRTEESTGVADGFATELFNVREGTTALAISVATGLAVSGAALAVTGLAGIDAGLATASGSAGATFLVGGGLAGAAAGFPGLAESFTAEADATFASAMADLIPFDALADAEVLGVPALGSLLTMLLGKV